VMLRVEINPVQCLSQNAFGTKVLTALRRDRFVDEVLSWLKGECSSDTSLCDEFFYFQCAR